MAVFKGPDLLNASQGLLERFDVFKDLVAGGRVGGFGLLVGQGCQLEVDGLGFGQGVEEAGEEGAFLAGHLGGGRVVGDGAVADGPDVFGAVDDEVFVDRKTSPGVFLGGDLGHEVFDDGAHSVAGGPDEQPIR